LKLAALAGVRPSDDAPEHDPRAKCHELGDIVQRSSTTSECPGDGVVTSPGKEIKWLAAEHGLRGMRAAVDHLSLRP
jgi:hypothetical protein